MKIIDVYKKYSVPPVLQNHMLNVTKVALSILEHWEGTSIDKHKMTVLCLVHDLGNIVRIDFNKQFGPRDQWLDIDEWNNKKKEIIDKYGDDDDTVTEQWLRELGVDDEISKIIFNKRFINSKKIADSDDWLLKILLYSDLRVTPIGIATLQERLDEVLVRRIDLSSRPDIKELVEANKQIENDIQLNSDISLSLINDNSVKKYEVGLLDFEI